MTASGVDSEHGSRRRRGPRNWLLGGLGAAATAGILTGGILVGTHRGGSAPASSGAAVMVTAVPTDAPTGAPSPSLLPPATPGATTAAQPSTTPSPRPRASTPAHATVRLTETEQYAGQLSVTRGTTIIVTLSGASGTWKIVPYSTNKQDLNGPADLTRTAVGTGPSNGVSATFVATHDGTADISAFHPCDPCGDLHPPDYYVVVTVTG